MSPDLRLTANSPKTMANMGNAQPEHNSSRNNGSNIRMGSQKHRLWSATFNDLEIHVFA